jgi:hypothetical protein
VRLLLGGLEDQVWGHGRLVGVGDPGETLDLPRKRLLVEALDVALGGHLQGDVHENLDEVYDPAPHLIAGLLVGRDGRHYHRYPVAREQIGHEPDPQDVYVAILPAEAEPLTQVGTYYVAVQHLHPAAPLLELVLDDLGYGGLASPRETREPQGETALLVIHGNTFLQILCLPHPSVHAAARLFRVLDGRGR